LFEPLRLEQLALALELVEPYDELVLDRGDRVLELLFRRDVMFRREDLERIIRRIRP
jgi:hypothetical protein